MIRNLLFFSLLLTLTGCINQKKAVLANPTPNNTETLELKVEKEIKKGSVATFEFINNGIKPITVLGPSLKIIEKFENGKWRRVRILYCPCGANCNAPPQSLILKPSEKHVFEWNLMEGWCDKKQENGIPKTIENPSTDGLFRISVDFSTDGTTRQTISNEFKIIN